MRDILTCDGNKLNVFDFTPTLNEFEGDPESWDEINEWIKNHKMERGLIYYLMIEGEGDATYRSIEYAPSSDNFYLLSKPNRDRFCFITEKANF
mmetsp:Transcript_36749/g.56293  ORF Transcript_36749/g.56293 Transcript_36749/m.56293 type:complete len:94 (+) Transcript_36749:167-448(+)